MWHRHLHLKHLHLTCSQWWINEDLKINPQKVFLSIVQRWYFWNVSLGKTLRLLSLVLTEQQVQRTLTNILEVRVRMDWTDASVECMCSYNPASGESFVICDPVRSILKILEQNWENLAMVKKKLGSVLRPEHWCIHDCGGLAWAVFFQVAAAIQIQEKTCCPRASDIHLSSEQ